MVGNHIGSSALNHVALHHVHDLTIFEKGYSRG
jgi:hypothetical protein